MAVYRQQTFSLKNCKAEESVSSQNRKLLFRLNARKINRQCLKKVTAEKLEAKSPSDQV